MHHAPSDLTTSNALFCNYVFRIILGINNNHFLEHHKPVYSLMVMCFLRGSVWILKNYLDEFRLQRTLTEVYQFLLLPFLESNFDRPPISVLFTDFLLWPLSSWMQRRTNNSFENQCMVCKSVVATDTFNKTTRVGLRVEGGRVKGTAVIQMRVITCQVCS